ncbi:hypothetical protein BKA57DRAFT_447513 [Linnemannia elongata]|nr:hypothetical protein BKA57DRAFT_447513 [Linnemannia elongata]
MDRYGSTLKNKAQFVLEVVKIVRANFPTEKPSFLRVSALDLKDEVQRLRTRGRLNRRLRLPSEAYCCPARLLRWQHCLEKDLHRPRVPSSLCRADQACRPWIGCCCGQDYFGWSSGRGGFEE